MALTKTIEIDDKKVIFKASAAIPRIYRIKFGRDIYKDLARLEGLMCGISSGTNVAAALRLARKLGKGKTVVTILPDTAERYFSTPLFQ